VNKNTAPKRLIQIFCIIFILPFTYTNFAADKNISTQADDLESVQSKIADVKSDLDQARTESEKLQEELRVTEIIIGKESLKLKGLEEQIQKRYERLIQLNNIIKVHEQSLEIERQYLFSQLRSAYMNGRNDYLKLLLNQEDPTKIGRVLAYHDYYIRARTRSINSINDKVNLVDQLKTSIQTETESLEKLKQRQLEKKEELLAYRESRNLILGRLQDDIRIKGEELKSLREHEQKLAALLNKLDKSRKDTALFGDMQPFESFKGKLEWPTNGKILVSFGSQRRKGTSLKWQGVKISARSGDDVRAIHNGKVIFADWFRNLGLLVIIDHDNGYMSLYGYNQGLLKKPGDWVLAGEPVAHVGDSGGQTTPGVYFEIRYQGNPLNPALWCKK
jgi:murein hydrolase activator